VLILVWVAVAATVDVADVKFEVVDDVDVVADGIT